MGYSTIVLLQLPDLPVSWTSGSPYFGCNVTPLLSSLQPNPDTVAGTCFATSSELYMISPQPTTRHRRTAGPKGILVYSYILMSINDVHSKLLPLHKKWGCISVAWDAIQASYLHLSTPHRPTLSTVYKMLRTAFHHIAFRSLSQVVCDL